MSKPFSQVNRQVVVVGVGEYALDLGVWLTSGLQHLHGRVYDEGAKADAVQRCSVLVSGETTEFDGCVVKGHAEEEAGLSPFAIPPNRYVELLVWQEAEANPRVVVRVMLPKVVTGSHEL